jgi:hypothetical protein
MPRKPVEFDPLSADEVEAARRWYARRSPATADQFQDELDQIIDQIGLSPDLWPAYLHGTRVVRVGRFPYLVVYDETDERSWSSPSPTRAGGPATGSAGCPEPTALRRNPVSRKAPGFTEDPLRATTPCGRAA